MEATLEVTHEADLPGRIHVVRSLRSGGCGRGVTDSFEGADRGDEHVARHQKIIDALRVGRVGDLSLEATMGFRNAFERRSAATDEDRSHPAPDHGVNGQAPGVPGRAEDQDACHLHTACSATNALIVSTMGSSADFSNG